jgi:hypothetical protein
MPPPHTFGMPQHMTSARPGIAAVLLNELVLQQPPPHMPIRSPCMQVLVEMQL